jgi:signal transduction histidine kinase
VDQTLETLASTSIPMLGDWCFVDMLDDLGRAHRVAVSALASEPRDLRAVFIARDIIPEADRTLIAEVLRGATAQLVRDSSPGFPATLAATAEELAAIQRLRPTSALIVPLSARGQTLGAVTFLMASSRRRHGAADLALGRELGTRVGILADNARLYRAAEQANRAKSEFLAAMSHELRTPLTAIVGYAEILADGIVGPVAPIQREQLLRIRASSDHLTHLVEEILAYARLEAGREEVVPEKIDVRTVIDQTVTLLGPRAEEKGLSLKIEVAPDLPRITTDRLKLRQIILNLLSNAVKFTQEGEVGIVARCDDEQFVVEVWDTGMGIPEAHLEQIFAPFWQVHQHAARSQGGSGLGLALVRRMTRLLGGEVTVESAVNRGSRFRVALDRCGSGAVSPETSP